MELYQHQKDLLKLNPKKYGIFDGMGSGKTISALMLAKQNNARTLVIAPKPVLAKWEDAMSDVGVDGDVIGREQFRLKCEKLGPYDAVICDESHYAFANLKAQGFKKLYWYIKHHDIEYVWLLSGTPYASNPWNLYAQAKLLGHDWNYIKFRDKFFYQRNLGFRVIWEPRANIEAELGELVATIGRGVTLADCFDVPDQIYEVEHYTLTAAQKKGIKAMQTEETDPVVRIVKEHQIASGTLKGNEFTDTAFYAAEKNDQIISYAEVEPKMVVFSRYNAHLELLKQMLDKKKIPCAIVNGSTKDKEAVFKKAEESDRMVMLINSMVSVGYELPSFPIMLFASLSFSYVDFTQGCHRILRANALKKNVYKIMITKGTVDEAVYKSVKKKENFSAEIYSRI